VTGQANTVDGRMKVDENNGLMVEPC